MNIEEIINKKSETVSDKINNIFNRIEFLELSGEHKKTLAEKIKKDAHADKIYWIAIFLSSIIAALWLLQNSVAVVIGAMLIAPLLSPINGISFAVARWEKHFFWKTIKILFGSMAIAIAMGYISVQVTWLNTHTAEIIARAAPNIIDLCIAIFSAIVAVLSLWFYRLSESVGGVAMSVALLPPLAVVWIELALGNYHLVFSSFMLFLANFVAIILVGTIMFWLYGFTPHTWEKQTASVKTLAFIVVVMGLISIPLFSSLFTINQRSMIEDKSHNYLQVLLSKESSNISIDSIGIAYLTSDTVELDIVIKIPEGINFYDTFKKQIENELSQELWKTTNLDIQLIRVASIISQ